MAAVSVSRDGSNLGIPMLVDGGPHGSGHQGSCTEGCLGSCKGTDARESCMSRLADPTHRTDCGHDSGDPLCISVDSWWADLNYYLSTIPFLAAIDSGLMGVSADNIILLPPSKDQTNFCYNVSSCHSSFPEAMKMWNKFYKCAMSPSSSFDDLLKYMWDAHVSSLEFARKNFQSRSKYYSKQKADFQSNWALLVDYLAPSLFPTTLDRVCEFQKGLPPRILVSGDPAHFISDFNDLQNKVLLGLKFLHIMHKYSATKMKPV
ncbi:hypothetical protein H1C71_026596 [Ictidomys tridecemlineatus]|uniref:protein LEG1 homolog n=1 Tax=Ictidomys tridecemlineatus TaxID=43179 RepID=UPI000B548E65|nr:protein LEG1 homolog [Ictidomys tridecemlineatus]KAG3290205.1 hypothetical protein H1C71_026596 [Ictidomys tridecemlineatus]